MATQTVAATAIGLNGIDAVVTKTCPTGDTHYLTFDGADNKLVIIASGSAGDKLTLKAGNGIQGVTDVELTLKAGTNAVRVDSGLFKIMSGSDKGKIAFTTSASLTVGLIQLP